MGVVRVLQQQRFVSRAILERRQTGILPNQAPVRLQRALGKARVGDVQKQCCDAETESRRLRRFCPDFFKFRQKGSRFRIAALGTCEKTTRPKSPGLGRVVHTMPERSTVIPIRWRISAVSRLTRM